MFVIVFVTVVLNACVRVGSARWAGMTPLKDGELE